MLVGLFLWFWNLVSFFADSPIWVFQKYFNAKKIFTFWAILMFIVSIIFLYFIFKTDNIEFSQINDLLSFNFVKWFLSSTINILLLIIASTFYWIIKEISEVTSLSYIMNNSDPSQYSELFSKRSIFAWVGSLMWLILSWVILAFYPIIAVSILVVLIIFHIFFIHRYFDSSEHQLDLNELKKIKLLTKDNVLNSIKDYKTQLLDNKKDLIEKTKNLKVIFLKPIELKNKINFKEILKTTIDDLKNFVQIMFRPPYNYRLLVIWGIFVIFGFWDTFVTTFLIDYIDNIIVRSADDIKKFDPFNIFTAYVFIALFCVPAYWWQIPLVKIANKLWVWKIMIPWLLLGWISMFIFWVSNWIYMVLLAWLLNWLWYASCMPTSQWEFSNEYNITYSNKNNLKQIDANASSAPTKMLSNLANVIWLALGWFMLSIFDYIGTFFLLGAILIWLFVVSVWKGKEFKLY
jgi:hypothetical protein